MSTLKELCADREHWSYSSLNQFLNICSLQWAFQRYHGLKPEFTPVNLSFGSAFHRTLEAISLQRLDGKPMPEEDGRDLFADLWSRQQEEDENIRFDEKADAEALNS
jgi:putative RecB family exonuclease